MGIWTKPHSQFHRMPLTYFPVGKHRGDAHGAHMAPERDMLSPRALSRFQTPSQGPLVCSQANPVRLFKHCSAPSLHCKHDSPQLFTSGLHLHSPFSCFRRAFLGLLDQR